MSEIEYLDQLEKQIRQARARVTTAKNELIEAGEKFNELQLSITERRIQLLQQRHNATKQQ